MNKKFIEKIDINDWEILTDSGFVDIIALHKTIPYTKWRLKTENCELNCADNHIVFVNNYGEKFIKDLLLEDLIITKNGLEKIIECRELSSKINMYDFEIDSDSHRYYTNNILSHNTSTAFILAPKEKDTTLYINASEERGIDVIREKIGKFCATISLESGREQLKVVILDEIDGATEEFFKALRAVMEKYAKVARFIATCNFIQKIPEPVRDRFNCISYDAINNEEEKYLIEEYKKRIGAVLTAAKIKYTPEILSKFVNNDFPSLRSLMNKTQSFYLQGISELNDQNFNINYDFVDLFKLCLQGTDKPYENYKLIISEYSSKIDDTLSALGQDLIEYIKSNAPAKMDKIPLIIIAVAEHQAQRSMVIDPLITLLSCIFKIQTILK